MISTDALVNGAIGANRDWEVIAPLNNNHKMLGSALGAKISREIHGAAIYYPVGLSKNAGGNIVVANYYAQPQVFDASGNHLATLPITYQDATQGDGIRYLFGVTIDHASGKIAACSWARGMCRVYTSAGALLFSIGVWGSNGNVADGKLTYPRTAVWLPNGNLLVVSYGGVGDGCTNQGHVTEYDGNTGALVATRLGYFSNGQAYVGSNDILRPIDAVIDPDDSTKLWVSVYGRTKIARVDMSTWKIEEVYTGQYNNIAAPYGLCIASDGTIVVCSHTHKSLVGINPIDHSIMFDFDLEEALGFTTARDVIEIGAGRYAVAGYDTHEIAFVQPGNVVVPYTAPTVASGWEIAAEFLPSAFDLATAELTISSGQLDDVSNLTILKRRI